MHSTRIHAIFLIILITIFESQMVIITMEEKIKLFPKCLAKIN